MERTRLALFVAVAFFGGAILAAALFSDGVALPGVSPSGASRVTIEVQNAGSRNATATVQLNRAEGGGLGIWNLDLPAGSTVHAYRAAPPLVELHAAIMVSSEHAMASGHGDFATLADPRACKGGQELVIHFTVDTTRGVSFSPARTGCE